LSQNTFFRLQKTNFSDPDPDYGAFLPLDSGSVMGKKSGMEKIRIRDPGWRKFGSRIRDKHPGSATLQFSGQKTGDSETHLT
jgi:hypothetical protein